MGKTPQQSSIPLRAFSAACMSLLMETRPASIFSSCSEHCHVSHHGAVISLLSFITLFTISVPPRQKCLPYLWHIYTLNFVSFYIIFKFVLSCLQNLLSARCMMVSNRMLDIYIYSGTHIIFHVLYRYFCVGELECGDKM